MQKGIWLKNNRIKKVYPYLYKSTECDVIVVGGGICGAITAFFLAKDGFNVCVIEKDIIGRKNTGISSACITDFVDEMYVKGNKEIERKLFELNKKANSLLDEIIVDIEESRYLKKSNYNILNTKLFQKGMLKSEMKIREQMGEKTSMNENGNGIDIVSHARLIDSYYFTQKVFEYISHFPNVHIFENTAMINLDSFYDYVEITTQNGFKIKGNSLIFTTIDRTFNFNNLSNVELYKRFSIALKSNIKDEKCIKILNDIPIYIRVGNDGEVIASGIDTRYTFKMDNDKYLNMLEKDNTKKLKSVLTKIFPKAEFSEEIYSYSGNIITSKDKLPIISEIDKMPNVYFNIGMGSSSIAQILIGADLIKESIKGYYKKEMNLFKLLR